MTARAALQSVKNPDRRLRRGRQAALIKNRAIDPRPAFNPWAEWFKLRQHMLCPHIPKITENIVKSWRFRILFI